MCFDVRSWTPDGVAANAAAEAVEKYTRAETSADSKPASEPPPLPFIDIAAWDGATVPEREWVVQDRVPLGNVTLLSGEGGVGKSIVSLHLAVATVLGRDWLTPCRRRDLQSLCAVRTMSTSCTAGLIE